MEVFERINTIKTRPNTDALSKKLDKALDQKMEQIAVEKKRVTKEQAKLDKRLKDIQKGTTSSSSKTKVTTEQPIVQNSPSPIKQKVANPSTPKQQTPPKPATNFAEIDDAEMNLDEVEAQFLKDMVGAYSGKNEGTFGNTQNQKK